MWRFTSSLVSCLQFNLLEFPELKKDMHAWHTTTHHHRHRLEKSLLLALIPACHETLEKKSIAFPLTRSTIPATTTTAMCALCTETDSGYRRPLTHTFIHTFSSYLSHVTELPTDSLLFYFFGVTIHNNINVITTLSLLFSLHVHIFTILPCLLCLSWFHEIFLFSCTAQQQWLL